MDKYGTKIWADTGLIIEIRIKWDSYVKHRHTLIFTSQEQIQAMKRLKANKKPCSSTNNVKLQIFATTITKDY